VAPVAVGSSLDTSWKQGPSVGYVSEKKVIMKNGTDAKATFWGAYSTANFDHENFNLLFGVREWVPPLDPILTLEVVQRDP
jgi:hypothetical protein